jgi:hypothetical protein
LRPLDRSWESVSGSSATVGYGGLIMTARVNYGQTLTAALGGGRYNCNSH